MDSRGGGRVKVVILKSVAYNPSLLFGHAIFYRERHVMQSGFYHLSKISAQMHSSIVFKQQNVLQKRVRRLRPDICLVAFWSDLEIRQICSYIVKFITEADVLLDYFLDLSHKFGRSIHASLIISVKLSE